MSDHEPQQSSSSDEDAPTEPTRYIRVSLRPPPRYAASTTDLDLWLKRFELYVRRIELPEEQWAAELLPLLDDEAFRVVSQLGLESSTDYGAITASLKHQFSPKGNELEWQHKLQTRRQQPGEQLVQYAGALRMLADKAYPSWTAEQRREVLRNHFIQGLVSPSVQLRLMREIPATFDDALQLAVQLQSVETAQKRLHKEVHRGEATTMAVQLGEDQTASYAEATASNAVAKPDFNSTSAKLEEMAKEIRRLSSELAQLKTGQATTEGQNQPQRQQPGAGPTCWNCNERGHVQRSCPHPRRGGRGRGRMRASGQYRSTSAFKCNPVLVVDGYAGNRLTHMLIDTGSDVSIIREDVWKSISKDDHLHSISGQPVTVANGGELHVLSQAKVALQVGDMRDDFTCLIARELTQECILGSDFLVKHHCIINLSQQILRLHIDGQSIPFHVHNTDPQEPKTVCHVFFPETTVLPGQTEVELPLSLTTSTNHGTVLLEPARAFIEKYGVLIARSLTLAGTGTTMVRMLNPSSAPVTIYQNEKAGELHPITGESVCTIQLTKLRKQCRDPALVEKAIELLLPDSPELKPSDKQKLQELLYNFSDVVSVDANDLGQTTLVQHEINTGDATPIRQPAVSPT